MFIMHMHDYYIRSISTSCMLKFVKDMAASEHVSEMERTHPRQQVARYNGWVNSEFGFWMFSFDIEISTAGW